MRPVPVLVGLLAAAPLAAQTAPQPPAGLPPHAPTVLTEDDYARAERFLAANVNPLLSNHDVRPNWHDDDRFSYRNVLPDGHEFILVDAARRTRVRAFDHERLAAALGTAADTTLRPLTLPFQSFERSADGRTLTVGWGARRFACDIRVYTCTRLEPAPAEPDRTVVVSPDGRLGAFVRDHDLWVRELDGDRETRLTYDGQPDVAYATNNAGWTKSDRPVLLWSPDSRRIATFQHDGRGVGEMVLTTTNVGHPRADVWKYPLPGDSAIFMIHRVVIELDGPRVVRLRMPPDAHRSTTCDHIVWGGRWTDIEWTPDARRLVFISSSRDHRRATVRVADAATGEVRDVMEEVEQTFYESGFRSSNWRVLAATGEMIWYSQRDDWGHLYLVDLETGRLKNRITHGAWNVLDIVRIDEHSRTIWLNGVGREPGDPYFRYLYRVRLDGSGLTLLTPDSADHTVSISPSGRWIVDVHSTPDRPPVAVLRDDRGRERLAFERADLSRLAATGWTPPTPFIVRARDGRTDLYGLLYRPTAFDSTRRYPIINRIYPGPQSGSVGGRSFAAARADSRALAELGFIVVEIDAMGTPLRSKSFHAAYYGDMGDNGLPDHVAGMKELGARHPWIDLDRVGIWGHSGGGFASTGAILRHPDFFKVAVSQAGNHDNRVYEDDWGEKWHGLLVRNLDGTTNYDDQANQTHAANLEGRLLITHGTMDDNVPYYATLLVVDALIAANRDFDMILFPNRRHGFGNEPYMMRRRWDYFVRHLLGAEPPREYVMGRRRGP
jgi:dipeptidyl-peptidase-4